MKIDGATFVKVNGTNIRLEFSRLVDRKMGILAMQILKDCNYFCRQDQGTLIASSYIASQPNDGKLVWDTPYAKRMYFTGQASKDVNQNAEIMWCEKARARFGGDWEVLANKLMKREG